MKFTTTREEEMNKSERDALSAKLTASTPVQGAVITVIPICPHFTNTQLEKMGGCPKCGV